MLRLSQKHGDTIRTALTEIQCRCGLWCVVPDNVRTVHCGRCTQKGVVRRSEPIQPIQRARAS